MAAEQGSLDLKYPLRALRSVVATIALLFLIAPSVCVAREEAGPQPVEPSSLGAETELSSRLSGLPSPIVNGVLDHDSPSVGFLFNDGRYCTGTLIGCRSFLTAAHCICTESLSGSQCGSRPDLLDPSNKFVFFQHAGGFGVSNVTIHPDFLFGTRSDLALLRLSSPVPGVRPSRINQTGRPAHGSDGAIVGFGRPGGASQESGIKRTGLIETAPCAFVEENTHICWDFLAPTGPPGEDSSTCQGDSGGPLFMNLGQGSVVAGVTSGGLTQFQCLPPNNPWDADVFVDRAWIQSGAGADLHRTDCGSLPFAGEPGAPILFRSGTVSAGNPDVRFNFPVPANLSLLAVTLNGSLDQVDADLYLRRGAPPTTNAFDCKSDFPLTLEACGISSPQPGTWHILVHRFSGSGPFQVTVTLFEAADGGNGGPPPPPGPWLSAPALSGFEAKVLINNSTLGKQEADCIPETLCVSGALAGRPEIFVKVIGPRLNGFLWSQLSRFTPSIVEVWLRQLSSGQVNYYVLDAVGLNEDNVSGLQDREAFSP